MLLAPAMQQLMADRMSNAAGQWVAARGEQLFATAAQPANSFEDFGFALSDAGLFLRPLLESPGRLPSTDLLAQDVHGLSQLGEVPIKGLNRRITNACPASTIRSVPLGIGLQLIESLFQLSEQIPLHLK